MCADLFELPMHDFDVILGMDLLHSRYACIDCRSRVMIFFKGPYIIMSKESQDCSCTEKTHLPNAEELV